MSELTDRYATMTSEELQRVIDGDEDGELLFALEEELMELIRENCFSGSETFGEPGEETDAERCLRVVVESMGFPETLSAIDAIEHEFPLS